MTFSNIPSYDGTTAGNNTDVNGVSIAEGFPAANINNAMRNMLLQMKQYLAQSVTLASASSLDFGAQTGNYLLITGTTAITALGTVAAGTWKMVEFAAALTLTHNATSLILPGGINITTAAGDTAMFVSEGSGNWRLFSYQRGTGSSVIVPQSVIAGLLATAISGTNTTAAVTISAGQATDSTTSATMLLGSTNWAVSNGNAVNGYQGGTTLPNGATIHFYIISGTSGTGSFASTSLTPTLPSGYTLYRRIFSLLTDASGNLAAGVFREIAGGGLEFLHTVTRQNASGAATVTTAAAITLSVPIGFQVEAIINAVQASPDPGQLITLLSSFDSPNDIVATGTCNLLSGTPTQQGSLAAQFRLRTNTSGQIRIRSNITTGLYGVSTVGWADARRN